MINFDDVTKENIKEHNPNWPQISDHPYRILKVVFATFWLVCFSSLEESTYEIWKNIFYFTSKALFVLEKIKF